MKRLALCIGNNEYSYLPKLRCAINDADKMSKVLTKMGFETIYKIDLDRDGMITSISDFIDKLDGYDSCFFYYAGHGFQIEGENFLAPIDLNDKEKPTSVKYYAFPLEDLMRNLDKYSQITKVFVFDACRTVLNGRGALRGFAPVLAPQGSIIAFATSPGQSSDEDSNTGHGVYTNILLKYIDLPRVNIEAVFKKTREHMVGLYGSKQIPWEHTSLIGNYYLNPNTIYDGVNYSPEALADKRYISKDSLVKRIIDGLKSYDWYIQGDALDLIDNLDFNSVLASDLFVIGRNIYQAACGNCWAARNYISDFATNSIIAIAKLHILNGIAYEIYFDSFNNCRSHPKINFYNTVIQLLEIDEFFGSRSFIASELIKKEYQLFYIPGQNEKMEFIVEIDKNNYLTAIIYNGENVLVSKDKDEDSFLFSSEQSIEQFRKRIAEVVVAPIDYIDIIGEDIDKIDVPFDFTLRKRTSRDNNA